MHDVDDALSTTDICVRLPINGNKNTRLDLNNLLCTHSLLNSKLFGPRTTGAAVFTNSDVRAIARVQCSLWFYLVDLFIARTRYFNMFDYTSKRRPYNIFCCFRFRPQILSFRRSFLCRTANFLSGPRLLKFMFHKIVHKTASLSRKKTNKNTLRVYASRKRFETESVIIIFFFQRKPTGFSEKN